MKHKKINKFVLCKTCKKTFKAFRWQIIQRKNLFCSQICYHKFNKGSNHCRWKGWKKSRDRILLFIPKHPSARNKYIQESRYVCELLLKRYLTSKEQVHHINKIAWDNRPKNLYLFKTNSDHVIYHHTKISPKLLISNLPQKSINYKPIIYSLKSPHIFDSHLLH